MSKGFWLDVLRFWAIGLGGTSAVAFFMLAAFAVASGYGFVAVGAAGLAVLCSACFVWGVRP